MRHKKDTSHTSDGFSCCSAGLNTAYEAMERLGLSRRRLILGAGTAALGSWAAAGRATKAADSKTPAQPKIPPAKELIVQPVLTYHLRQRKEQTSWRPWGGLMNSADVNQEVERIKTELHKLKTAHNLAVKFMPMAKIQSEEQASKVKQAACDVLLVYAASGDPDVLKTLVPKDKPILFFLRHRSGPVSQYYEILHPYVLRHQTDQYLHKNLDVHDVVVDDYHELAWRLRALAGLRQTLGKKIVAVGGASGWGPQGYKSGPAVAREKWYLDIIEIPYPKIEKMLKKHKNDQREIANAARETKKYLAQPNIELHTNRKFVENSFILYSFFKKLMNEHQAGAFTIRGCMFVIIPMAETTACLPLSLLNDEGYLAFCESDFTVIPAGM
ncbi:MAG: hypothetical protein ACYTBZ_21000, partial [Planctomycetota bacterium]